MYNHLVNNGVKVTQEIWRMKLPLKIKIFLWFLKKGYTHNLAKRNWNGSKVCSFYNSLETIKHLFFDCIVAKALWRMVHCVFGLRPPRSIAHMFGGWSKLGQQKHNLLLLTGAAALCWVIWLIRNDLVFNKCQPKTFLQVLFRATYWLRFWAPLQQLDEHRVPIQGACRNLESQAMFIFALNGWNFSYRLGN
jgi:hypothetical protein